MPEFGYSFQGYDPLVHVRASIREGDASPKAAREICVAVKGLTVGQAKTLLDGVIAMKKAIPFRRYKKEVPHRSSLQEFHAGKFPVKAAKKVMEALRNLEANAEFKGYDAEKLQIIHAAAHRGRAIRNWEPRAFGRSSPSYNTLIHIELVGREI